MEVTDPDGVKWEVSRQWLVLPRWRWWRPFLLAVLVAVAGLLARVLFGRPWVVEAKSERGELQWRVRGTRGSRRAMQEIAAALRRGDRTFLPPHAERLLPESPLSSGEPSGSVRVLRRRT